MSRGTHYKESEMSKTLRDEAENEILDVITGLHNAKVVMAGPDKLDPGEARLVFDNLITKAHSVWNYIKSTETPENQRSR